MRFKLDAYSWFSFKKTFETSRANSSISPGPKTVHSWVPEEDGRRIASYNLIDAYSKNAGREWLNDNMPDEDRGSRREYGDPNVILEQTRTSIMGHMPSLFVKDAVADTAENTVVDKDAQETYRVLKQWIEEDAFDLKMEENETYSGKFGDSCISIGWQDDRPVATVWDPATYFPNLRTMHLTNKEFPDQVAICYQFEEKVDGKTTSYIRRILWTLVDTEDSRSYAWRDKPVFKTCLMSDGVWSLDNFGQDPWGLDESRARYWIFEEEEIGFDFVPVIHFPNTYTGVQHYGTSELAAILQLFDDITAVDSDIQAASATTGSPPLVISGIGADNDGDFVGPGMIIRAGDGNATMLDTSRSLDALLKNKDSLLERLSVNSQTPESLLGRVKPNEVPSGVAITLSFATHTSKVESRRRVRRRKYTLLFRMVSRMYMANGILKKEVPAQMMFGSYLPADKQEVQGMVVNLLGSKAVSLETAVTMLKEAGFPIEDAIAEVRRIRATDYESAQKLYDLTGDSNAVAELINNGETAQDLDGDTVVDPVVAAPPATDPVNDNPDQGQ